MTGQHRVAWRVFSAVSVLTVGGGVVAALASGHQRYVVAIIAVGLCLVGVAAGFMSSMFLPLPGYSGERVAFGTRSSGGGGFDGGGSGGGDCGGGGGDC